MKKFSIPFLSIVAIITVSFGVLAIPDHSAVAWTCALSVDKTTITAGESAKLSWTYSYPDKFVIDNGIGNITKNNSSVTVSPTVTTTYTGTVTDGKGNSRTCGVTIIVTTPPPCNCTISATKKTIVAGDSTTLSWDSENAVSAVIDNGVGTVSVSGTKTVSPTETTTYTITFTDKSGKKKTCVITIVVTPKPVPPTCTVSADRTSIVRGESTTITWNSEHALTAKGPFGDPIELHDSWTTSPTETTTYTFTFYGTNDKKVECSVKIVVTTPPPTDPVCTLTGDPTTLPIGGGSVHLVWTSDNAVSGSLDNGIGNISLDGSKDVNVTQTTTFKATFKNAAGKKVTCAKTITVTPPVNTPTCTMSLSPDSVVRGQGTSVTLTWSATNVTSGFIDNGVATVTTSGSTTFIPNQETLYTGTFTGPYGNAVCTARVVVTTPPCTVNCGGGGFDQPRVEVSKRDLPNQTPLAFVYLSQVPYTGFPATPLETALYWLALVVISGVIAYYIVIKNVIWKFAATFFGNGSKVETVHYVAEVETPDVVAESRMSAAPFNLPGGVVVEETFAAPHFGQTGSSLKDSVEGRAHRDQILLSPEVVDTLIAEGSGKDSEVMALVESALAGAKAAFPREDGWILVNRDRLSAVLRTATPRVSEPAVSAHVAQITEQFKAAVVETPVAPVTAEVKASYSTAIMPKEISTANFIAVIAEGKEEDAYKMLRTLTTQGKVHSFMLEVIASLDAIYTNRIEGGKVVDAKIAEKTAVSSNAELESLLAIMIAGIDYTYSSDQTATKLAVTKAIEFFKSKQK